MKLQVCVRGLRVATALFLTVGSLTVIQPGPASGTHDGPPVLGEQPSLPQIHRPGGGGAVRIFGEGLLGATSVTVGGVAAPDFRVVDSDLIIATMPPANPLQIPPLVQNDGYAHITVTDDQGTGTTDLDGDLKVDDQTCSDAECPEGAEQSAIFYTDATLTMTPSTGLDHAESVDMTLRGHHPDQGGWPFVHLNPLVNFLEDGTQDPDAGPPGPPYGAPLTFAPTDAFGNASATVNVSASPTFNVKDQDYDADADCPVAQITADYGLDRCILGYSEFGMASMEKTFSYSPDPPNLDPVPAAPTLALNWPSAGNTVTVSGANWNAAPHFGSDTNPDDPGESAITIEICDAALTSCTLGGAPDAEVAMTRYRDADPTNACISGASPPCIQPSYTGATLSGSFTAANTAGCAPNCVARVRQQRYDIEANAPLSGEFITATAPLSRAVLRAAADFDGDGRSDIAVYRPDSGAWFVQGGLATQWGTSGDVPVPADYDGNGTTDVAVFRPSDQTWYVQGGLATQWGTSGDVPVPADYDGNGTTEAAVFRPGDQTWYVQGGLATQWGTLDDVAVPADYSGDGDADVAVFRPSDQTWYVQGGSATQWGATGDVPVAVPAALRSVYGL